MAMPETQTTSLIGARVRRKEDPRLLAGKGAYLDDIELPGMLEAAVLRSPYAHARILSIDVSKARSLPGVFDVLTGDELIEMAGPQPVVWRPVPDQRFPEQHALAVDKVRWVGQAVAVVAAVDRYVAEDALEFIDVDYEVLPAVPDLDAALASDAPRLYDDWDNNVSATMTYDLGDVEAAFAEADIVVKGRWDHKRQFGASLETRGCIANWDPFGGRLEVWLSTQSPNLARDLLGEVLDLPVHQIRVRVPDVGGGFGNKFDFYGEEILASVLSRRIGRPIKLVEDRRESFMATSQSRDERLEFEMAAKSDGTILGMRGTAYAVLGGALGTVGIGPPWASVILSMGPYKIPNLNLTLMGVLTNRPPYGSYRGWGQPKANLIHERLVELVAREAGLDPNEVRRKNFPAPEEFPHFSGVAFYYDSGRYADCLDLAIEKVTELGWPEQKEQARSEGRSVGIGFAFHVEVTAFGPSRILNMVGLQHSGFDEAVVRMDSTGRVTVYSGQSAIGQGIQTALAQIAAEGLGISIDDVNVVVGDTDACPFTGYGTGASRAAAVGGAAVMRASAELRDKILGIAAHLMEAAKEDLEISNGTITVKGVPDISISMAEIGDAAYRRLNEKLPVEIEPTLEAVNVFDPENTAFSYGCTAVLAEVDRETGVVKVLNYLLAHDCGTVINPMIVEGQLAGGATQAIASALYEELIFDEDGQLRTASFMDYLVPTASEIPRFDLYHQETPAPHIPGGMKGVGEAGTIGGGSAVASAVDDALSDTGISVRRFPITPPYLLEEIRTAQPSKEALT